MVSLSEFTGESAVRKSIEKKRLKAQEKLDKINTEKAMPLIKEIADYDRVLKVMDDIAAENAHASEAFITATIEGQKAGGTAILDNIPGGGESLSAPGTGGAVIETPGTAAEAEAAA